MRKMLLTPLIVCIAALLFVPFIPAVYAKPPTDVSGDWNYVPTVVSERPANGNNFVEATTVDEWTGDITGEGGSVESVIIHEFVSWFDPTGFWYAKGILTLYDCTVEGTSGTGTLVIRYVGKGTPEGEWTGEWVILSGTDGLANIHGQGTWAYPGGYEGQIHFDP